MQTAPMNTLIGTRWMRVRLFASCVLAAFAFTLSACAERTTSAPAALGAPPRPAVHVGPIPGPAGEREIREPSNPFENDAGARQDGRRLFVRYNCSGCHGGRAGGGMGPSLRDDTWIYGSSPANVFSSIAEGRANGMPAWGSLLPQDQIWQLVAYVRTLGSPQEADPPTPAPDSAPPNAVPAS